MPSTEPDVARTSWGADADGWREFWDREGDRLVLPKKLAKPAPDVIQRNVL